MTGESRRVPALDGLRGVAILLVVLHHAKLPGASAGGAVGVALFFALSGWLITRLLLAEHTRTGRISIRAFWVRRAVRLLPAFLACVLVYGALVAGAGGSMYLYVLQVLPALGYMADFATANDISLGGWTHAWTLSVEEQFYLLWPLVLPALLRRGRRAAGTALAVIVVAGYVWRVVAAVRYGPNYGYTSFDTNVPSLALGCSLALLGLRLPSALFGPSLWGLAVVTVAIGWAMPYLPAAVLAPVVAAPFLVLLLASCEEATGPVSSWRPLLNLGAISYGLYLWHHPLLFLVRGEGATLRLVALAVSVAAAAASWRWLERPLLEHHGRTASGPDCAFGWTA